MTRKMWLDCLIEVNTCVCLTVYVNKNYTELTERWDNSGIDLDIGQSATEHRELGRDEQLFITDIHFIK